MVLLSFLRGTHFLILSGFDAADEGQAQGVGFVGYGAQESLVGLHQGVGVGAWGLGIG